jgi:transcriptional regulator with XRE-family HTH domain
MLSPEEARARVLAAYTDDLLTDREPTIPSEAMRLFSPEQLAQVLSTARFLKGLLRPSGIAPISEASLRARLMQRVHDARAVAIAAASQGIALPALLAERRRAAGLSVAAVAARTSIGEHEVEELEADRIPLTTIPPERLLDIGIVLAIPWREFLNAALLATERWLPRLTRRGMQMGLAGFQTTTGMVMAADREAARREAAEAVADYLARLEHLARERGLT